MNRVVLHPSAERDLAEIALHISQESVPRAQRVVRRLRERCALLAAHPLAGPARPEFGADVRSLSERPYVIFYRAVGDLSEVLAFVHGARDLPVALRKDIERGG